MPAPSKPLKCRIRRAFARAAHLSPPLVLAFVLVATVSLPACQQETLTVSVYDPSRAWNGYTYFTARDAKRILCVDMDGNITWDFYVPGDVRIGNANGFRYQDGEVAYISTERPMRVRVRDDTILFEGPFDKAHHSIVFTPQGTLMYLSKDMFEIDVPGWYAGCVRGDRIREIDQETGEIVWEWRLRDHLDPTLYYNRDWPHILYGCLDWSHGNTVKFIPSYEYGGREYRAVLYNALALETFWMIDYDTGGVLWSCGQFGTFGRREPPEEAIMAGAHEVSMLENDVFILYDNGIFRTPEHSRALKIQVDPRAGTVTELWSWSYPGMYDPWGGDADELPNGNVLLTNVVQGRLIEVTSGGDIVWDMSFASPLLTPWAIYQFQRVAYP